MYSDNGGGVEVCIIEGCTNGCITITNQNLVLTSCVPIQVSYTPTVTDLCCSNGTVTNVCIPPSGSFFEPGTTSNVLCVAWDSCGNTNYFSFTVTVLDYFEIQYASYIGTNSCSPVQVFYPPLTVTDLCCGTNWSIAYSPTNGSYFDPNTTKNVQCVVWDDCGHSTNFSFTVTVLCTNSCGPDTGGVKYLQSPNLTNGFAMNATSYPQYIPTVGLVLADDFPCTNSGPITDIHLWGSWLKDQVDFNATYTLAIWSDVPSNGACSFSQPGQLLWTQTYSNGQYTLCLYTNQPEGMYDSYSATYKLPDWEGIFSNLLYLSFDASPTNIFYQTGTPTAPTNYWLSVTVHSYASNPSYFGWQSSVTAYNDAAVADWQGSWSPMMNMPGAPGVPINLAFKITTAIVCVSAPTNLVLWLPFDETNGNASANLASPINYGTHVGNPTPVLDNYVSNSLSFNGANQYVTVPDYPGIEIGTNDFTIDAWIQCPTNSSGVYTILDKRTYSGGEYTGYIFDLYYNTLLLQVDPGHYNGNNEDTYGVPSDGQWHFVAVTVQRTATNGIQFYVDGQPTGTSNPTAREGNLSNNAPMQVGGSTLANTYWLGGLDEVEVFNRALAPGEIQAIYSAGSVGKCKKCYASTNCITLECGAPSQPM